MWQLRAFARVPADLLALQAHAERAGGAWACAYSSSDEFEAAVIRSKLDAGAYGPKRRRRYAIYAGAAAGALAIAYMMF
jgi:hypothetical protein